jgi:hypothetical protein
MNMTKLLHAKSDTVQDLAEEASRAACKVLDGVFPGKDRDGISSNFQGLLAEALGHMLKGCSLLDASRGHSTQINRLVADDSLFGQSMVRGDWFLVTQGLDEIFVLEPGRDDFRPIEQAGDAWLTFEAAANAALAFCRKADMTVLDVIQSRIEVKPVVQRANSLTGYLVCDPFSKTEESR